jgi:thiamine-monophosphate kinase
MDLSDGLLQDLATLCEASGIGATIDPKLLPVSEELGSLNEPLLSHQIGFGEDYQLLFTATTSDAAEIQSLGESLGIRLTRIGKTTAERTVVIPGADQVKAWTHFQEGK